MRDVLADDHHALAAPGRPVGRAVVTSAGDRAP